MRVKFLGRLLAELLIEPKRKADVFIGGEEETYMRRWWLIPRNRWFNIYLHHVMKSDEDRALHDHPWWSLSLLLRGEMLEVDQSGRERIEQGQFRWRGSEYAHRLEVRDQESAWTLFVTGPVVRSWGFHCPKGWVHWKKFTDEAGTGVGAGCGED